MIFSRSRLSPLSRSSSAATTAAWIWSRISMRAGAQRRVADASARIDARPEQKAEMIGARRSVETGHIGQRAQADAAPRLHQRQALDDEGAVEAGQGRDIGHRRQRDEVQTKQQVGLQPHRKSPRHAERG